MNVRKNVLNLLSIGSDEVIILKVDKMENADCEYFLYLGNNYDCACLLFNNLPSEENVDNIFNGGVIIKQKCFPDDIKQWNSFVLNIYRIKKISLNYNKFMNSNYSDVQAKNLNKRMDNL